MNEEALALIGPQHQKKKGYDFVKGRLVYIIFNVIGLTFVRVNEKQLRWSRGSVLAFGTQVRGFKPGRSRRIF